MSAEESGGDGFFVAEGAEMISKGKGVFPVCLVRVEAGLEGVEVVSVEGGSEGMEGGGDGGGRVDAGWVEGEGDGREGAVDVSAEIDIRGIGG